MKQRVGLLIALAVLVFVASVVFVLARGDSAKLPGTASEGPSPTLPEPNKRLIPTVHIAPAKGWTDGAKPVAAARSRHTFSTRAFASMRSRRARSGPPSTPPTSRSSRLPGSAPTPPLSAR